MTREETIKVLLNEWKCIDRNDGINCDRQCEKCDLVMDSAILKEAYNMAIKALEQAPCDDAISRQAVLDCATLITSIPTEDWDIGDWVCLFRDRVSQLPPVRPQEKIGHWILLDECANSGYYCSECQKKLVKEGWSKTVKKIKFCPNCGARMVEPTCDTCKYNTATFNPCNACDNKSLFEPQESEEGGEQ